MCLFKICLCDCYTGNERELKIFADTFMEATQQAETECTKDEYIKFIGSIEE